MQLFCSDVSSSDVVIATLIGSKYEQFAKHRDEHMDAYIAKILRYNSPAGTLYIMRLGKSVAM